MVLIQKFLHFQKYFFPKLHSSILSNGCMDSSIFSYSSLNIYFFLPFSHSQKFTVTFITKMCLSPAHFHQFLHPSIETHYEGPAKSGMIVEIKGHPKPVLMPNCLGIVNNVPQTITIFVGVHCTPIKVFLWAYMGVHCTPTKSCWDFCGRTIMWAYKFSMGVHGRTWA